MAQELKIGMLVQYIEPDCSWGYMTIEKIDGDYIEGDGYCVHKDYCEPVNNNQNVKIMDEKRVCKRCGRELPLSEFHENRFGPTHVCKDCYREARQKASKKGSEIEELKRQLRESYDRGLEKFSARDLMQELYRRGYEGELLPPRIPIDISKM